MAPDDTGTPMSMGSQVDRTNHDDGIMMPVSGPLSSVHAPSHGGSRSVVAGPRIATPRSIARTDAPAGPEMIPLSEHRQWPIPLFQAEYADRMVPKDSELGLRICLSEGTWKTPFSGSTPYETDLTIEALCKRWGAPGECAEWDNPKAHPRIKYKIGLWTKTENDRTSRPIVERTVVRTGLPQDCMDEIGEEPWPIGVNGEMPANTPQVVRDEIEFRTAEREAAQQEQQTPYEPQERISRGGQQDPRDPRAGRSFPFQDRSGGWIDPRDQRESSSGRGIFGAEEPKPPPMPAGPGMKWAFWNDAWIQVPDGSPPAVVDAPPPYQPAPGNVWAKINGAWAMIPDPNRVTAPPTALEKLIASFAENPAGAITALVTGIATIKTSLDSLRPAPPPPPAPAPPAPPPIDFDAKLAAMEAKFKAEAEMEKRIRAEADAQRANAEAQRANAEAQRARDAAAADRIALATRPPEPKVDPATVYSEFVAKTKQNAKMLGLSEPASSGGSDSDDGPLGMVMDIAHTPAGVEAAKMLTGAVLNWISKQPPGALEPVNQHTAPQTPPVAYDPVPPHGTV